MTHDEHTLLYAIHNELVTIRKALQGGVAWKWDAATEPREDLSRCLCPENFTGCPVHGMLA